MQGKIFDNSTFLNLYYDKNFQKKRTEINAKTGIIEIDGEKMLYVRCLVKRKDLKLHPILLFFYTPNKIPQATK